MCLSNFTVKKTEVKPEDEERQKDVTGDLYQGSRYLNIM